jgi:nucleoside-diphosphate-sugar epimerase
MKVLITGAAGVLGKAVTELLEAEGGYDLRLTDMAPLETEHEFVQADLADWEQVEPLAQGVEQVLHIAAIHPWKQYSDEQYLDCNIKGTFNVVRAAAQAQVDRLIYTSSVASMGYAPSAEWPLPFDETKPCFPEDHIYSVSKHAGEQFCHLFHTTHQLDWLFLRPGCFIPCDESEPWFGLALLVMRLNADDVAQGHLLALKSNLRQEALLLTAGVPFTQAEGPELLTDARSVILRHFPAAAELEAEGTELPQVLSPTYRIDKARELIGYEPQVNFGSWLAKRV